jgi:CheY-like chemotaxis protein
MHAMGALPMTATVLLADDDADCLKMLALRCRSLGLRVVTARDGADALASAERESPDLAILDIGLPGDDGLAIAERLRRKPGQPMPIIVCSGHADRSTLDHCRQLGARHVAKGARYWPQLRASVCELLKIDAEAKRSATAGPEAMRLRPSVAAG